MDSLYRQPSASELIEQIAQHLRQYPCDLRHARKLLRRFHASAADVIQAINQVATPLTLQVDPTNPTDKVLLHLLQFPGDVVDMRWVIQQCHASESDVQHALEKLETYIVDGGEGVGCARIDKK